MLMLTLALVVLQEWVPGEAHQFDAKDCDRTDAGTALVALDDLGWGEYLGHEGGLYPGGVNHRPSAHDAAGLQLASSVQPLDRDGNPDPNGAIGLLSIGMSNAQLAFQGFAKLAKFDPEVNDRVVTINGAQPGWGAELMQDPSEDYWIELDQIVDDRGLSPLQIQVLWFLQENIQYSGSFPAKATTLADQMENVIRIASARFPNARIGFMSSRIYGGYTEKAFGTEPLAYENGFSVKWTIERQLQGDPDLNWDPGVGPVLAPWLAWGPYTWSNGVIPRSDALVWECDDFLWDGLHPGVTGVDKVAQQLLRFFKSDAAARPWFLQVPPVAVSAYQARVTSYGPSVGGSNGPARLAVSTLPTVPTLEPLIVHGAKAPAGKFGLFLLGFESLPSGIVPLFKGWLLNTAEIARSRITDGFGQARWSLGLVPDDPALWGAVVYVQYAVKDYQGVDVTSGLRLQFGH